MIFGKVNILSPNITTFFHVNGREWTCSKDINRVVSKMQRYLGRIPNIQEFYKKESKKKVMLRESSTKSSTDNFSLTQGIQHNNYDNC